MLGILFLMSSVGISLNHLRMVLSPVNLGDFISDKSLIRKYLSTTNRYYNGVIKWLKQGQIQLVWVLDVVGMFEKCMSFFIYVLGWLAKESLDSLFTIKISKWEVFRFLTSICSITRLVKRRKLASLILSVYEQGR